MPRVTIEGIGTIVFPDDMSAEEIQSIIEEEILPHWDKAAEDAPPTTEFSPGLPQPASESAATGADAAPPAAAPMPAETNPAPAPAENTITVEEESPPVENRAAPIGNPAPESTAIPEPVPSPAPASAATGEEAPRWQSLLTQINDLLAQLEPVMKNASEPPVPDSCSPAAEAMPIAETVDQSRPDTTAPEAVPAYTESGTTPDEPAPLPTSATAEIPLFGPDGLFAPGELGDVPVSVPPPIAEDAPPQPEPHIAREEPSQPGSTYVAVTTQILFPQAKPLAPNFPAWHVGPDEYLERRLQRQIDWYDNRSALCQRRFKTLRSLEILAATAIPFLSGYSSLIPYANVAVGILGLTVAVVASLLSLHQYQERWMEYRATGEALKREKFLFLTGAGLYRGEEAFPMLVQQVEDRLAGEQNTWGGTLKNLERQERLKNEDGKEAGPGEF